MKIQPRISTRLAFVLLALSTLEQGCSVRRTTVLSGDVGSCSSFSATLRPASGNLTGISVNSPVAWRVDATGCTGKYRVDHGIESYSFSSTQPAIFSATYANARNMTEYADVVSLDSANKVVAKVTINSDSFDISAIPACSVSVGSSQLTVNVDSGGAMTSPIPVSFQISNSTAFSITAVRESGVNLPASSISIGIPTPQASNHSLSITIGTSGSHTYTFVGATTQCQATVVLNPVLTTAPSIIDFSASSLLLNMNEPYSMTLKTSGTVTSALIGTIPVTLVGGNVTRTYLANKTGENSVTASVTNTGGTTTRVATFKVSPTCQLRVVSTPTTLPGNLRLSADVAGDFLVGSITSSGIAQPSSIAGGAGVLGREVDVVMNQATAPILLTIYGPDLTVGTCGGTAVFTPVSTPAPTTNLTMNGTGTSSGGTTTFEVPYTSNVALNWTSTNATSCTMNPGNVGPGVSGNSQINGITTSVLYTLNCTGAGGSVETRLQINVPCPGNVVKALNISPSNDTDFPDANVTPINPGWRLVVSGISGSHTPYQGVVPSGDCRIRPGGSDQYDSSPFSFVPSIKLKNGSGSTVAQYKLGDLEGAGVIIPAGVVKIEKGYKDYDQGSNSGNCAFTLTQKAACAP